MEYFVLGERAAKYPIAHHYYDGEITSEMAYQIGLWATDGCIKKNSIYMKMVDRSVIDYIKSTLSPWQPVYYVPESTFVGINGKTYTRKPQHEIQISSPYLKKSLINRFGIYPRKSLTFTGPLSIETDSQKLAYLKGVIEGDGWILTYLYESRKDQKLGMCGTYEHCMYVQSLFKELFDIERNVYKGKNRNKNTSKIETSKKEEFLTVYDALKSISVGNDSKKFSRPLPNWLT